MTNYESLIQFCHEISTENTLLVITSGKHKRLGMTMRRYNANVRIGNWYYDLILDEEKTKQYMRRSENFELNVQRTRKLFLALLKEVPLSFPMAGLIYGAVIQILSPDMPTEDHFRIKKGQGIALAADISFRNVGKRDTFDHGDPVIGTGLLTPCVRNVWTLIPEDKSRQGKELRYGDTFYIQFYSSDKPLYVECITYSPGVKKGECGHVTPTLSSIASSHTRFKVVKSDPRQRFESEGSLVQPFEKVGILQAASHESLAVEPDTWFPTYFGMECEVSVWTFKDVADRYYVDPRNFWSFHLSA